MIQDNWRWCKKCQVLAFAGSATLGPCPAGGEHNHSGSGDYALVLNDPAVPGQDNWRWCSKCQALSFAGNPSLGKCKAGGVHNHTGSGNYVLWREPDGTVGQDNWRWCNKCQVLAFTGSSNSGACGAGGMHDHSGSGDYVLAHVTDCNPLLQQINSLKQHATSLQKQITDIQSEPGYTQGPHDPHPGKPDPESLAEVKEPESQLGTVNKQVAMKTSEYDACQSAHTKAVLDVVCDNTQCVSISDVYANIAARLNGKVVG